MLEIIRWISLSDKINSIVKYFALVSQLGLQLVVTVLIGGFIGYKLDAFFKTPVLFTVIGLLLGVIGGFYGAYRLILQAQEDNNSSES